MSKKCVAWIVERVRYRVEFDFDPKTFDSPNAQAEYIEIEADFHPVNDFNAVLERDLERVEEVDHA